MRPNHLTLLLLASLLFAVCAAPTAGPAPTPRPIAQPPLPRAAAHPPTPMPAMAMPAAIPGHGLISVDLPARGTPGVDPTLTFIGASVDRATGAPVAAAVYLFYDEARRSRATWSSPASPTSSWNCPATLPADCSCAPTATATGMCCSGTTSRRAGR